MATINQSFEGHNRKDVLVGNIILWLLRKMKPKPNPSSPIQHCFKGPSFLSDSIGANQAAASSEAKETLNSQESWERRGRGAAPAAPLIAYQFQAARPSSHQADQGWICTRHWLCSFGQTHFLTNRRGAFSRESLASFRTQTHINRAKFPHISTSNNCWKAFT